MGPGLGCELRHRIKLRFFTGLRPSEELALVVIDYDAEHGRVERHQGAHQRVDSDVTKPGEDRHVALCPGAMAFFERQLRLSERRVQSGPIDKHEAPSVVLTDISISTLEQVRILM